jgi:putative drug exporter of the RND superfamily
MSHLLQRLGRLSFRRRRAVLGVWVGLLLISAAAAGAAGGTLTSNFSVPGTESQQAIDLLAKQAPAAAGATGRIVFAAPAGRTLTGQERVVVQRTVSEIAHDPAVVSVTNPFATGTVSKPRSTG